MSVPANQASPDRGLRTSGMHMIHIEWRTPIAPV